ncbi:hypothetical protein BJ878DRAFT_531726 [Calycina marina]|uniref:Rhodopsin domain-containing protein n=1 Tax=Calycina marina TaxID=1763456 RepID=A0A9P8CIX6_9HELO|nr:hypothetical protein BJ878DRAFT_531726 [Calycina marina]
MSDAALAGTESQASTVIAICVVFSITSVITIALRLFSRIVIVRATGLDDILMVVAALLSWGFIICTVLAVQHGLGLHLNEAIAKGGGSLSTYGQIIWFSSIFYNACLCLIKLSVLCLYLRLGDKRLRLLSIITIAIIGMQGTANVATCIFQCSPIAGAWNTTLDSKCVNIDAFYLSNAALNILTDLITYSLPIHLIINLHTQKSQKIALLTIFGLGFFACVSSIVRITFIPNLLKDADATWAITPAMYWSVVETNVAMLAASIPSFKPIAKRYLPRLLGDSSSGATYNGATYNGGSTATGAKDSKLERHQFDKIQANNIALKYINGKSGVTTTIRGDNFGTDSDEELDQPKQSNSSEQDLVEKLDYGQIKQLTHITQTVETSHENR